MYQTPVGFNGSTFHFVYCPCCIKKGSQGAQHNVKGKKFSPQIALHIHVNGKQLAALFSGKLQTLTARYSNLSKMHPHSIQQQLGLIPNFFLAGRQKIQGWNQLAALLLKKIRIWFLSDDYRIEKLDFNFFPIDLYWIQISFHLKSYRRIEIAVMGYGQPYLCW